MTKHLSYLLLIIASTTFILSGCGQKGALYLPKEQIQTEQKTNN